MFLSYKWFLLYPIFYNQCQNYLTGTQPEAQNYLFKVGRWTEVFLVTVARRRDADGSVYYIWTTPPLLDFLTYIHVTPSSCQSFRRVLGGWSCKRRLFLCFWTSLSVSLDVKQHSSLLHISFAIFWSISAGPSGPHCHLTLSLQVLHPRLTPSLRRPAQGHWQDVCWLTCMMLQRGCGGVSRSEGGFSLLRYPRKCWTIPQETETTTDEMTWDKRLRRDVIKGDEVKGILIRADESQRDEGMKWRLNEII